MRGVCLSLVIWLALAGPVPAQPEIDRLLADAVPPVGVVFEIVEGDPAALGWALPRVAQLSRRLRDRFPGLPVVVVTHGREQFGLLNSAPEGPSASVHASAQELHANSVDLHVCGTHAGWKGYGPEDFPAYVDVAASGPAQIRDYRNLGYELVRLRRAD